MLLGEIASAVVTLHVVSVCLRVFVEAQSAAVLVVLYIVVSAVLYIAVWAAPHIEVWAALRIEV